MSGVRIATDVIALLAFGGALGVTLGLPVIDHWRLPVAKGLLAVLFGLFVLVAAADVTADFGIAETLHPFEHYVETLVPIAILGVLLARRAGQRYEELVQAGRALKGSHDLMLEIVDGAPAGILFLDQGGKVALANDAAKEILDLEDDGVHVRVKDPAWILSGAFATDEPGDLSALVRSDAYDGERFTLERSGARMAELRVSGRPFSDQTGSLGGAVVTFERV